VTVVLFEQRLRDGLHDGSITVAFRRWKRRQVVAGGRYRTGAGLVEAVAVDEIDPAAIGDADAVAAGYATPDDARCDLRGDPGLPVFRIEFRPLDEPDPRASLAAATRLDGPDLAALDARLDRLDARWRSPPTTREILRTIAARPHERAGNLADDAGVARDEFKRRVRFLKELGLTTSEEVGYRVSPRGAAYLRQREDNIRRADR
jgi:hypothetical protein